MNKRGIEIVVFHQIRSAEIKIIHILLLELLQQMTEQQIKRSTSSTRCVGCNILRFDNMVRDIKHRAANNLLPTLDNKEANLLRKS